MIGITTAIVHDKRIKCVNNTYAVKLRITYNRIQKYYPLNVRITVDEWNKIHSKKPHKKYKEKLLYFNSIEQKAQDILKDLHPFSFATFEKRFNQKPLSKIDVFTAMQTYIDKLAEEGRAATAYSYNCALASLKKRQESLHRKKFHFWDVTEDWLKDYEKWMIENGKSYTTVGIYLRSLRSILNQAIK